MASLTKVRNVKTATTSWSPPSPSVLLTLDVSPFGLIVVLGLVKSKGHRSFFGSILRGVLALATNAPALRSRIVITTPRERAAHLAALFPAVNAYLCQVFA